MVTTCYQRRHKLSKRQHSKLNSINRQRWRHLNALPRASGGLEMNNLTALLSLIISTNYIYISTSFKPAFSPTRIKSNQRYFRGSTNKRICSLPRDLLCAPNRFEGSWTPWDNRRPVQNSRPLQFLRSTPATAEDLDNTLEEHEKAPGYTLAPHDPNIKAFEDWTTQQGFQGGLVHADFDGLRGLMAKKGVAPWKPLVTVPASLILQESSLAIGSSTHTLPPEPLSLDAWQRCPWWVRLGIRLLEEKSAGEDSRFRKYIKILPQKGRSGTPLHWSSEQLQRLHYPRLLSQVALQRRIFQRFQRLLLADVNGTTAERRCGGRGRALVDALADSTTFNWALECVLSRAFQLPPNGTVAPVFEEDGDVPRLAPELEPPAPEDVTMALLPLIDSMNHFGRMPTHMYWEDDGAISLAVGVPLDPGDHAFLSYGPVSNDDLLQFYGFVERDNPSDTYVLEDMGKWLREDGFLWANISSKFLACAGARECWRYLRRGVFLRDAVHPSTLQAVRVVCCEGTTPSSQSGDVESRPWDGTEADLERFRSPVSLASELAVLELLMRYSAREADAWAESGVAAASAEDANARELDADLDGLGLDPDRRLMLSVFRKEKIMLLRNIVSRLNHMRKVSDMLNKPIKIPVVRSPSVLGAPVSVFRNARGTGGFQF